MNKARKHLSANGMLQIICNKFEKITSPRELAPRDNLISLSDCLMSAFAIFNLKFPSLLKFDERKHEKIIKHNLKTLYQVKKTPCDTYMRERCDEVAPKDIRKAYTAIFAEVQRGNMLKEFTFLLKDHYLLSGDGTGFFSSKKVHCENCCSKHYGKCKVLVKKKLSKPLDTFKKNTYILVENIEQSWTLNYISRNKEQIEIDINMIAGLAEIITNKTKKQLTKEEIKLIVNLITEYYKIDYPDEQATYYHNMFCASIVHPEHKIVLPLAPEPIMKSDGTSKNDCERNAAKRLYADARREHAKMKFIVVEDSIASNVPHLEDLHSLNMRYIVGAKPGDHKFLFDSISKSNPIEYSHETADKTLHRYNYVNDVQLNKSHDFKVNFLEYWEVDKKGKQQHFSWVTDIEITNDNVYEIMRGGRSNWKVENNTFNTLKNQDYHFSHNFGHGNKNLSTVFGMLMMLSFLVDQIQEFACFKFQAARAKFRSRTSLWEKIKSIFINFLIVSWEDLFDGIANGHKDAIFTPDSG